MPLELTEVIKLHLRGVGNVLSQAMPRIRLSTAEELFKRSNNKITVQFYNDKVSK